MKWSFVIQQKLKAAFLLSGIMVFIMLNSFISRSSVDSIDQSFSSIYEDRLIPAIDIIYLSEHLYSKRLLLERTLSNKNIGEMPHIAIQLDAHSKKMDSLITAFEKTSLVEEEVKSLDAFKQNIQAYAALEKTIIQLGLNASDDTSKDLFYTQGSLIFEKSIQQLGELTKIQSVIGKKLMKDSHTEAYYFNLLSTLQIASAIVVGILILGLIYSSKIINKDSTPFHLN